MNVRGYREGKDGYLNEVLVGGLCRQSRGLTSVEPAEPAATPQLIVCDRFATCFRT